MSGLESVGTERFNTAKTKAITDSFTESAENGPGEKKWFERRIIAGDVDGTILLQNALILMENQEAALAENLFRALLNRDSRFPQGIYWLAQCQILMKRFDAAERMARQLTAVRDDFYSRALLAEALYQNYRDADALEQYFKALAHSECDTAKLFEIYKNMGNIFVRQGDFEAAEEYYCKAHAIDSSSDVLAVNLGTLEIQQGNLDAAVKQFRRALAINIENDKAWVGLALIHRQVSDFELSWANVNRALDINPGNKTAIQLLLEWAADEKQWQAAVGRLKAYLDENGMDAEVSFALAKVLFHTGAFSEAAVEVERAYALDPGLPQIREIKKLIRAKNTKSPSAGSHAEAC